MALKQASGKYSPDGSKYGTFTDGENTLVVVTSSSLGTPKQTTGSQAPDGSIYFTVTDGAGNLT